MWLGSMASFYVLIYQYDRHLRHILFCLRQQSCPRLAVVIQSGRCYATQVRILRYKGVAIYCPPPSTAQQPSWARASSSWGFPDHSQLDTTLGRTFLDEGSAYRRDLYLTTQTTLTIDRYPCPRRDSNPQSFNDSPQTLALDRSTAGIGPECTFRKVIGCSPIDFYGYPESCTGFRFTLAVSSPRVLFFFIRATLFFVYLATGPLRDLRRSAFSKLPVQEPQK